MTYLNALTVEQYLHNKDKRANAIFISGDVKLTIIDGIKYNDEELSIKFPTHLRILRSENIRLLKGFNQDKTKVAR
jgi:sRNA-binding carbon storage regulator CsrA